MTKAEFLATLEKDDKVKFTGSTLRAPTFRVGDLLCAALKTLLPEAEMVRCGIQTSTFLEATWTGQLVWLLVLRAHLLPYPAEQRAALLPNLVRVMLAAFLEDVATVAGSAPEPPE